jgi:hypothetical protein
MRMQQNTGAANAATGVVLRLTLIWNDLYQASRW